MRGEHGTPGESDQHPLTHAQTSRRAERRHGREHPIVDRLCDRQGVVAQRFHSLSVGDHLS